MHDKVQIFWWHTGSDEAIRNICKMGYLPQILKHYYNLLSFKKVFGQM